MPRSRVANLVGTITGTSLNVASITLTSGLDVSNQANNAYAQANSAYTQANLAFDAANNRVLKAGDTMTGQLNISTGGLLVTGNVNIDSGTLFVDTINDSIGIGTANPARKLDVRGGMRLIQDAVPTTGALVIRQNVSDNVGGIIQFVNHLNTVEQGWISSDTNGDLKFATLSTEKMRITSNGNVGFGTTSPSNFGGVNLNVNAPSSSTYASQLWVSGAYTMEALVNENSGVMSFGSRSNHKFELCTNDTTRLTISNIGNVGIGTTSPATKFHVSGGAIRLDNAFSFTWAGNGGWNGSTTGTQFFKFSDNHQYYDVYDGGHYFRRSGSNTSFVIDATGNVQISAAGTEERFLRVGSGRSGNGYSYIDIVGDATYGSGLRLIRLNTGPNAASSIEHRGTGALQLVTQEAAGIDFYTNGGNLRMRVNSDGNIGVGTTSIAAKLHVHNTNYGGGTASLWQYAGTSSSPTESADWPNPVLSLRSYGNFYLQTMLSFGLPNDADYKTDDSCWNFRLNGVTASGWDNNSNITPSIASSANVGLQLLGPGNLRLGTVNSKNIFFRTNNSDVVTINGSGEVGIGTTSPGHRLDVRSDISEASAYSAQLGINSVTKSAGNLARILFSHDDHGSASIASDYESAGNGNLIFSTRGGGDPTERMRISASGSVGIGTSSPTARLDVRTAAGTAGQFNLYSGNNSTNTKISIGQIGAIDWDVGINASSGNFYIGGLGGSVSEAYRIQRTGTSVDNHRWSTGAAAERMFLNSSGILILGNTASSGTTGGALFNIRKPIDSGASVNYAIHINDPSTNISGGVSLIGWSHNVNDYTDVNIRAAIGATIDSGGAGSLVFRTGGYGSQSEKMRINSSGNVGIGVTSPSSKLHVDGTVQSTFFYAVAAGADNSANFGNSQSNIRIGGNGTWVNLNTSPWWCRVEATKFVVPIAYTTTVAANFNRALYVDNEGFIGYLSSTQASKTNIESLDNVSWLNQLNPVKFNYRKKDKDDNYTNEYYNQLEYGLIAEQVESVAPELCFYDEINGQKELRGISYSKLITPLIKAIQELKNDNDNLRSRLEALENK